MALNQSKLAESAQRGDQEAFLKLLTPLEEKLFQTALGILGNRQDAEDVWQNSVLHAWQNIGRLRNPQYFKTWLTRIVLNEAKATLRKKAREPIPLHPVPEASSDGPDIDGSLFVYSCLQRLAPKQREAVLLRYWLDFSLKELASTMGVPLSTAKTRLYEGVKKLEELMKGGVGSERRASI